MDVSTDALMETIDLLFEFVHYPKSPASGVEINVIEVTSWASRNISETLPFRVHISESTDAPIYLD